MGDIPKEATLEKNIFPKTLVEQPEMADIRYFSRPLSLPGTAIGNINIFFENNEIPEDKIKELGYFITSMVEDFFRDNKTTH